MVPSGEQIELRHDDQRAIVVEVGGGLRSYVVGGQALLDGYAEHEMASTARGQLLIPWPNRLRDGRYEFGGEPYQVPLTEPEKGNAIHGLVRWVNWRLTDRDTRRARLEYLLHPREGYPFALALSVEYELSDDGLTVRTSARNVGDGPCPYGTGAHPYLTAGTEHLDPCRLRAPGRTWLQTDDRAIPTGAAPVDGSDYDFRTTRPIGANQLDTGFTDLVRDSEGRAWVELSSPNGNRTVGMWQDESYPYVMLFTGDSIPQPQRRRRGLGVEPMTCAPNAFQTGEGLRTLSPGETFSSSWGITPGKPPANGPALIDQDF
jgi:aldose 1-epimerase